jgi:hypothetical protein
MPTNDMHPDDELTPFAAAVRTLDGDVHRLLSQAAAGELGRLDGALAGLQQQASDLIDRLGEVRTGRGAASGLRRRVLALQRRIFVMQWLSGCLDDRLGTGLRLQALFLT